MFTHKSVSRVLSIVLVSLAISACTQPAVVTNQPTEAPQATHGASDEHNQVHWTYDGETGPEHWGAINPEYVECSTGEQQSPIDLTNPSDENLANLIFAYKPSPVNILNNGHTVEVEYAPGSSMEMDGKRYNLLQFHFHSPSEHEIDGQHYAIELHLVHKADDGSTAVVGVLVKEGTENEAFAPVWDHLPAKEQPATNVGTTVDAAKLLPVNQTTYRYDGSLTTPPCTEGVSWFVMATPVEMSSAQIDAFRQIYDGNNRPAQPLDGRQLVEDTSP